MKVELLHHY